MNPGQSIFLLPFANDDELAVGVLVRFDDFSFIGRGVLWSDNDKLFLGDSFEKGHSVMINVMVE